MVKLSLYGKEILVVPNALYRIWYGKQSITYADLKAHVEAVQSVIKILEGRVEKCDI